MNKIRHYVLDDRGNPRPTHVMGWAEMFCNTKKRIVKQEQVGPLWVSTVFLGLDHNWNPEGPPILWETMAFRNNPQKKYLQRMVAWVSQWMPKWAADRLPWRYRLPYIKHLEVDQYTDRCSGNREQAEAMHNRVVDMVKKTIQ